MFSPRACLASSYVVDLVAPCVGASWFGRACSPRRGRSSARRDPLRRTRRLACEPPRAAEGPTTQTTRFGFPNTVTDGLARCRVELREGGVGRRRLCRSATGRVTIHTTIAMPQQSALSVNQRRLVGICGRYCDRRRRRLRSHPKSLAARGARSREWRARGPTIPRLRGVVRSAGAR